jgi:hypothetical protein
MAGRDRDLESCRRRGTGVSFHFSYSFFVLESFRRRGTDVFLKGTFRFALSQISVCLDTCWCSLCVPLCVPYVFVSLPPYVFVSRRCWCTECKAMTPPPSTQLHPHHHHLLLLPSPLPPLPASSSRLILLLLLLLFSSSLAGAIQSARQRQGTTRASLRDAPPLLTPLPYLPY